ncbi:MAG TPA: hypothetical protein VIF62_14985 [Labilithrix sp.]
MPRPRTNLLATLDDVEWEDLEHAHGSAEDVPVFLRNLLATLPGMRAEAQSWLEERLRGPVYSASIAAVPFLVELAREPKTPERAWIVRFLADVALGWADDYVVAGVDPDSFGAAYEAVEDEVDALCSLLEDTDADVRTAAAMTLAFFPRRAERVREAMRAALGRESSVAATASLLLGLAHVDVSAAAPLAAERLDAPMPLGLAAATALSFTADPRALPALASALARPLEPWSGFPWRGGDVASLALSTLARHQAHAEDAAAIALAVIESVDDESSARAVQLARAAVGPLLALVARGASFRRFGLALATRPELLSEALFRAMGEQGLPADLASLRGELGLAVVDPLAEIRGANADTVAARADAIDLAVALAIEGAPTARAIAEAAFARDPSRVKALAARFARRGPPVTFDVTSRSHPQALTLLALAAAHAGEPDPVFDVMLEAELAAPRVWPDVERYFRALPAERVERILFDLASRGWMPSWTDAAPIAIDATFVERALRLVSQPEKLLLAIAENGGWRLVLESFAARATPAILEAVAVRAARVPGDDDLERFAAQLAVRGLDAFGTLRALREREGAPPPLRRLCDAALEAIDAKSFVGSAMRAAAIDPRDDRGLVPLADARRVALATSIYRKGDGEMVDGTFVLESDRVWAALLSLESADELVRHAKRIAWEFHVRGRDNVALFERWGAAVLPWIETRIEDGVLTNVPWCLVPCLLTMDGKDALRVALKVDRIDELLPGQAPLSGPSLFAAAEDDDDDDDEDADDEQEEEEEKVPVPPPRGSAPRATLDLARRWVARNAHGYSFLAELAEEGDARAAELLRERAKALGGVVHEAIEASLGRDRTAALAKRLHVARTPLPEDVEAALEAAETADVPRGPLWTIAELDDAARQYELPIWDNARYTVAAMRVSGFASRHGDALVIETISTNPSAGDLVAWEARAFGPGAREAQFGESVVDVEACGLDRLDLDGADWVDGVTGQIHLWGKRNDLGKPVKGSSGVVILPQAFPPDGVTITLRNGRQIRVSYKLPRTFDAALRRVTPDEALVVQLVRSEDVFAREDALGDKLGLAEDALRLFAFDDFEWPSAGKPASSSKDLVLMTEALRRRKRITRLVGRANARPEAWIPSLAEARAYAGGDAWAPEDSPVEPELPPRGPFASAHDAWLVAERGWPHGITLVHRAGDDDEEEEDTLLERMLGASGRLLHERWPRRFACVWARVVAAAERWSPRDKRALEAARNDAMLYAPEARKIVARFATQHASSRPPSAGAELAWIVEALCGPRAALEAFVEALDTLSPAAFSEERPALAAAVFELGFVLRRATSADRAAFGKRLEARWRNATEARAAGDVVRALDLVLHGRAGAERSAREERDYLHVHDDRAWARDRLLDAQTPSSPPDLQMLAIAGEGMLAKWRARLSSIEDAPRFVRELARAGGPSVAEILVRLHEDRPEERAAIEAAFCERRDELLADADATEGSARALVEARVRDRERREARRTAAALTEEDDDAPAYDDEEDDGPFDDDDDDLDDA